MTYDMEGVIGESMRMKRRWRLHLGVSFSEVFFSPCSFACRWLVRPWHVFSPFPLRGKGLCIDLVSRSLMPRPFGQFSVLLLCI